MTSLREDALSIWHAAVDAVRPQDLIGRFVQSDASFRAEITAASRVLVVGAGKAGAAMAEALETALPDHLDKLTGVVNVPAEAVRPLKRIRLHGARPAGSNHPTPEGVVGAEEMLALLREAGPDDVAVCLISGGGSALLPAPDGVSLADKQAVTKQLHACGATIQEMNAVRKHLSRIKGGRLAQAFAGRKLVGLIISDVIGDPLDVIASGPTAADPSTFADAVAVLTRYKLRAPTAVREHLERGAAGEVPETLKALPPYVRNLILGNNALALEAAAERATTLGYVVMPPNEPDQGETVFQAEGTAGIVKHIFRVPWMPPELGPFCLLYGGETTVTLGSNPGRGGRNQEYVLAMLNKLGPDGMRGIAVLSGGTDGEDGPTDAAGAVADETTWDAITAKGLTVADHLNRHDAYPLFDAVGGLIRTGLTHTNVMDVRVILVGRASGAA
jgi:glycerate 2-kinase